MSTGTSSIFWGVRPAIGRTFVADEDKIPGARPVAILSYALWNTQFGADPNIFGRTIRINEQDYSAIGVMPKEIQQLGDLGSPDLWVPMMMHHQLLQDMKEASAVRPPVDQRSAFLLAGTLMMSIVGLVLLIACGNVANLLLSRAMKGGANLRYGYLWARRAAD